MSIDDAIEALVFPEGRDQGECVGVLIRESSILELVELLRKGCSVKYMTRRTFGPKKGEFINIQITRADR